MEGESAPCTSNPACPRRARRPVGLVGGLEARARESGLDATEARATCKSILIKPRKKAWICLDFFGGIGTFQRVTAEKIKKFLPFRTRVSSCTHAPLILLHFLARGRNRTSCFDKPLLVARILNFVNIVHRECPAAAGRGRAKPVRSAKPRDQPTRRQGVSSCSILPTTKVSTKASEMVPTREAKTFGIA
jgi:hypothetical protein